MLSNMNFYLGIFFYVVGHLLHMVYGTTTLVIAVMVTSATFMLFNVIKVMKDLFSEAQEEIKKQ